MPEPATALQLRGVSRLFGSVQALDAVDFEVARGSVHALLGENGAGKSTLMRIAYGLERRDRGSVTLLGRDMREASFRVAQAIRVGVGMVHQHLSLAPTLTAVENLVLGGTGRLDTAAAVRRFEAVVEQSGLAVPPHVRARDLSIVQQQRLEILKALARDARVVILDEPTAVLAPTEIDELLGWMRRFADAGGAVIFVTHKLREALTAADQVTVLRRGRVALRARRADATEASLAHAMFPERMAVAPARPRPARLETTIVRARELTVVDDRRVPRVRGASFDVHGGDIVALAGVEGSGVRELLLAVAGLTAVASGQLELPSQMGFIPADRTHDGLVPEFTLTENVALRGAGARRGVMAWAGMAARTAALLDEYDVTPRMPTAKARTLSGGNQQRVVVARELDDRPDLVVADNPTRGLDIQASEFVLGRLVRSAVAEAAVLVHSSDLDEMLSIATRVLVVFDGNVRETPLDREIVGRAMVGAA
jgi:simple sugar transport system ATP-binding protein